MSSAKKENIGYHISKCFRASWIIIILLCLSITAFQAYNFIHRYTTQPTSTVFKTLPKNFEFPLIWLGYSYENALNQPEMERILGKNNLTNETFAYLKSFIAFNSVAGEGSRFDIRQMKHNVLDIMKENGYKSVIELFKSLFIVDTLPYTSVAADQYVNLHKVTADISSIYYQVSMNGSDIKNGQVKVMQFSLGKSGQVTAWLTPYNTVEFVDTEVGAHVEYKLSKTVQLSTKEHPCRPDRGNDFYYTVDLCKQECAQWKWRERFPEEPCYQYAQWLWLYAMTPDDSVKCSQGLRFGEELVGVGPIVGTSNTTIVNDLFMKEEKSLLDECAKTCWEPCEQWVVDVTTTPGPYPNNLEIQYPNGQLVAVFEEVPAFTWNEFFVGTDSVISLWLAVILMSLFQAVYVCFGNKC